jgi:hypothetical protein
MLHVLEAKKSLGVCLGMRKKRKEKEGRYTEKANARQIRDEWEQNSCRKGR